MYKFKLTGRPLLLVVFLLTINVVFSQFVVQRSGTTQHLSSVFFSDENIGYAVGDSGTILKTINSGGKWQILENEIQQNIKGVAFLNLNLGFVIGDDNLICRTEDGGSNWTEISTQVHSHYTAIQFVNDSTGFIIGHSTEGGVLLITHDKGSTWQTRVVNKSLGDGINSAFDICDYIFFQNLSFIDENTGLIGGYCYGRAAGKQPFLCKTTDGGNSFKNFSSYVESSDLFAGVEISSINFLTPHDAYIVKNIGNDDSFLYTSDYKIRSFNPLSNIDLSNGNQFFFNSFFLDRFNGYITCLRNGQPMILKTIDLGETFIHLEPPTKSILKGLYFVNINNGYFVGDNGTILHLIDNTNVVHEYYSDEYADPPFSFAIPLRSFSVSEIYVYNVAADRKDDISVVFFDEYGNEIKVYRSRVKVYKNEIKIRVKTEDLTLGTYFFTVKHREKAIVNGKLNFTNLADIY